MFLNGEGLAVFAGVLLIRVTLCSRIFRLPGYNNFGGCSGQTDSWCWMLWGGFPLGRCGWHFGQWHLAVRPWIFRFEISVWGIRSFGELV